MRPTPIRTLCAAVGLALVVPVLAGCGSSEPEDALQQAMAEQFSITVGIRGEDAYCYAGQLLDYYGADEMQRFVDDPETFRPSTPTDQAVLLEALDACGIDPRELQVAQREPVELDLEAIEEPASATTSPG